MSQKNQNYVAWAEVNLKNIRHNYHQVRALAAQHFTDGPAFRRKPSRKGKHPQILAVVKADAYGHGMIQVAALLRSCGVSFLAVSDVEEGKLLRKQGLERPILLLESPLPTQVKTIIDYQLIPTVCNFSLANALNTCAKSNNKRIAVHVKIDTGMGRLGVWHQDAQSFIRRMLNLSHVAVQGIYTHFPLADSNAAFTKRQIKLLCDVVSHLDLEERVVPFIHAANSMGIARYQSRVLNLARPGLMLYGLYPHPRLKKWIKLKPALSVKARVIFVKRVLKGRGISYGHTFVAPRDLTVATIPMGYSDGYFRCLSNKSDVLIKGKRCPVIGNVTMDQIMVDVSRLKSVKEGQVATILGPDKKENITADELAHLANTINYEVVCNLGNRLARIYR